MDLSVVVVHYRSPEQLFQCLASLKAGAAGLEDVDWCRRMRMAGLGVDTVIMMRVGVMMAANSLRLRCNCECPTR